MGLVALAWFPSLVEGSGWIWSVVVWSGVTGLLAQVVRDRGRKQQEELYRKWNGKPTTKLLRHRDCSSPVIIDRRHRKLQDLLPDIRIPTAAEEQADSVKADAIYDQCIGAVRELTRDRKKYHLVFEENCNYGFRRNLWSLKSWGASIAVVGVGGILTLLISNYYFETQTSVHVYALGVAILLLLITWFTLITPAWVKMSADTYAEQLLMALERDL